MQASLFAASLLALPVDADGAPDLLSIGDERLVCIAETDACSVDAVQVLLGCSVGRGNLLFHLAGKQAYTFFDRTGNRSFRLLLLPRPADMERGQALDHYRRTAPDKLFSVLPAARALPETARIFRSYPCDDCGEITGENWLRLSDGKRLCRDCYKAYSRFDV